MDDGEARAPRRPAALAVLLAAAALACAGFVALGLSQVQRLGWKQALIAQVQRQVRADPVEAPGPAAWTQLQRGRDDYRRVRLQGRFDHGRETLVRASTALGAGYWVLTPLRTDAGAWVLVNRGFVPPARRPPAARGTPAPPGPVQVVGLLRFSEPVGGLLQRNDPARERWTSRDVAAIAAARGLPDASGAPVAPYFVDAEGDRRPLSPMDPQAADGPWPRPGLTVLQFSNNHAVYAATWFALAAMAAGAFVFLGVDARRARHCGR